jgi:hypothetical protein
MSNETCQCDPHPVTGAHYPSCPANHERRLRDTTVALANWARDFAGRYLLRLDSLNPEPADAAFERLKESARQFVEAERALDQLNGDEAARLEERKDLSQARTPKE